MSIILAKTDAWVESDCLRIDPGSDCKLHSVAQVGRNLGFHIMVVRIVLHGAGFALDVHEGQTGTGLTYHLGHLGIFQSGYIVDNMGTCLKGEPCHLGFASINRYNQAFFACQSLDHGNDPCGLLCCIDRE